MRFIKNFPLILINCVLYKLLTAFNFYVHIWTNIFFYTNLDF